MRILPLVVASAMVSPTTAADPLWPADADWKRTLEVGDYIIYRFSGSYTTRPVDLKKEVVDKRGDRAVVDVIASRGDERRHWIEVIPDVHRDVKPSIVYELTEIAGASRTPLAPSELARLYDWTFAPPTPSRTSRTSVMGTDVFLEHWSFACRAASGETTWKELPVKIRSATCDQFPWGRWEYAMWTTHDEEVIVELDVIETGRGGYAQVTCPAGTTPKRVKQYSSVVESCVRSDGTLDGPWRERDGHGRPLVVGHYRAGKKHGLWKDHKYGLGDHCMFADGAEVGFVRPWEWTHLRLGAAVGGGSGPDVGGGVSVVGQVGWDLWSRKRHCRMASPRKTSKSSALAAVYDIHRFSPEGEAMTIVRLGLQGHVVAGEAKRGTLDTGLFDAGLFGSVGMLVYPTLGVGASLGLELLFGLRFEARYDHLPSHDRLVSFTVGLSDGFLVFFD